MTRATVEHDVLVASCAISAGIHAALVPEHVHEEPAAGVGFVVSAAVLVALCIVLTYRPGNRLALGVTAAVLGALLVAYALAITVGVPVLHPDVELADGLGLVTKAVELVGLATAVHLATSDRRVGRLTRLQPKGTTE